LTRARGSRDRPHVVDAATRELVRLARNVLFTRKDAYAHLSNAKAAAEVRKAERAFWDYVTRTKGSKLERDALAAALVAGGVPSEQALRWSNAIIDGEDDDGIELDPPELCAHCGSALRGKTECGVCGQPRGSTPQSDATTSRAQRLVRMLVATNRLELASAHDEHAVVEDTEAVLADHADGDLAAIAAALEAAWMEQDAVADVFAETDEIIAALRDT
jgi:hypothetical protein